MICDVSKWQGEIDWDKLAPCLEDGFVIIKASGKTADQQYARNAAAAASHGVPFHVFHFLYCRTEAEARRDAGLFFRTVQRAGHWPLFWALDCEAGWGIASGRARPVAEAFETELRRLAREGGAGDIRVAIYVAQQKYYDYAMDYDAYEYVWIPGYGEKHRPTMPCDLWQYTDKGSLPGIKSNVDLNVLTGSKPMSFFTGKTERENGGNAMFTSAQLVQFCEDVYKARWVYWYGTYGKQCTEKLYNSKKKQYPAHYGSDRTAGYQKDIREGKWCADCVGLIKAFFWKGGDLTAQPVYKSNNCPDKSANGMIAYCSETGPIATMPDVPGLVVWKDGHIGVYVGGGYTVEMKGFAYDCKRNKLASGPWKKWGRLPPSMIRYTDAPEPAPTPEPTPQGLHRGDYGTAVRAMQEALLKWDDKCLPKYGADGDFGKETEDAVKAFQTASSLPVTGVYDEATRAKLTGVEPVKPHNVEVTGGSVNVRSGPGTSGTRILGTAHKGDRLPYQGESRFTGGFDWYLVEFKGQNGWISGRYSKVV